MAKTSQQFHLISFIKFCVSGEKLQSLSNLREKNKPSTHCCHRALWTANRQKDRQTIQEAEGFTHLLHISVW